VPRARTILIAVVVGVAAGIYLQAWVGWPSFVAIAVAAVLAVAILLIAASLEEDPKTADAAWRAASQDLDGHQPPEPGGGEASAVDVTPAPPSP
jgi:hypothetical protein